MIAGICLVLILLWSFLALLFCWLTPAPGLTVNLIVSVLIGHPYLLGLMLTVSHYRWLQKKCKDEMTALEIEHESKPEEERDNDRYESDVL